MDKQKFFEHGLGVKKSISALLWWAECPKRDWRVKSCMEKCTWCVLLIFYDSRWMSQICNDLLITDVFRYANGFAISFSIKAKIEAVKINVGFRELKSLWFTGLLLNTCRCSFSPPVFFSKSNIACWIQLFTLHIPCHTLIQQLIAVRRKECKIITEICILV